MIVRWLIVVGVGGLVFAGGALAAPRDETSSAKIANRSPRLESTTPIISEIVFSGLRRIAPAAVQAQISSREGARLATRRIETDVRALARLGWFGEIRVETQYAEESPALDDLAARRVRLIFHVEELPYLTRVEYTGSRLLSRAQIEKILGEKKYTLRLGEPAAPASLDRIGQTIQSALAELGHPQSHVKILREESPNATVGIRYEIADGPHIPVDRIDFEGHPEISARIVRRQMRRIVPRAVFASLRGKNAYTREGFEEDRDRILAYYQNHGFPEVRIGTARVSVHEEMSRRWIPWSRHTMEKRLAISVSIEAGPFYRVGSVEIDRALVEASGHCGKKLLANSVAESGQPYSAQATEQLRRAWLALIQPKSSRKESTSYRAVDASRTFETGTHTVRIRLAVSDTPPYIVRRMDFRGLHRFGDRYVRRRILLQEGRPLDDRALEAGLARLARTGYFHPIRKEDIHVQTDEATHTADVTVRIQEAGKQRASLSGGHGQFGSTLGIAYALFDLFRSEELLSAQIEGGPESLEVILGLAKEGFLGSRGSLALSVFNNVLRPRFASSVKGPFFTSRSEGLNAGWSYAVTNTDSVGVNYGLSHSNTDYSLALPASLTGVIASDLRTQTSSRSVGVGWNHDAGNERFTFANSVSSGWLGGSENLLRSSAEYARIFHDPFFSHRNAWAFRTAFAGAGSYQGDMPLYARLFSGDELVRGLRPGELGPYAAVSSLTASGNQTYSALPAGANLTSAANAEYRVPLRGGAEAAAFFDLGSGRLLPNWLGQARPLLLGSTNGILHGSIGIELRWTVPGIQVPVRGYYAVNVLRLNRFLQLTDGSLFHARNRFSVFGWALGTLF